MVKMEHQSQEQQPVNDNGNDKDNDKNKDIKVEVKKPNILSKIYRFFVPKDFKGEMLKGRIMAANAQGKILEKITNPKNMPTWYIGKGLRKLIDPKHKMKFGKEK